MSVDLEIQFKPILRVILMMTTLIPIAIGADSKVQAQNAIGRYPLNVDADPPESHLGNAHSPTTGATETTVAAEKSNATGTQSLKLQDAMEATRARFANQFEQAYARVASLQTVVLDSQGRSRSTGVDERSIVDFETKRDESGRAKAQSPRPAERGHRVGHVYPLVTPLPELEDVTGRFPRVASKPADLNLAGSNDFLVSPLPALTGDRMEEQDTMESGAANSSQLNWWNQLVNQPLHPGNEVQAVDSNLLVYIALQNSPRIQALSRDPLIRDFEVIEADAAFDPVSFLQTQFADRSDPLGGALDATRDGSDTIENHRWTSEGGLRKRARTGATYELSQRLGFENSNVAVFDPNNQGTAQIALNVTQPLARGRGKYINQSQILIAQSRGGAAWESFSAELQQEIEAVVSAYWRLYFDRSVFLQKKRNVERVAEILATLEGRANLDSLPSQITRARSSLQSRKTDLANAFRDVRNSETELRRLIADRNWQANQFIELLPVEAPVNGTVDISLDHVVTTSLENRPEIRETMQRAKLAGIERDISVNDLLPELSLLLGTYVSTLQDDGRAGRAFVDQFGETKPGYSVGLEFELPLGNRAARSRLVQRKLQLAKIKNQVDEMMQNVIAGSQTALRRLNSAAETLQAANQAIEAADSDMKQNIRRWENFALVEGDFADGQTPTTVLDQLLDSQERLAAAELVAAQSQLQLKVAEVALQREMGTLLIQRQIDPRRAIENGTPKIQF